MDRVVFKLHAKEERKKMVSKAKINLDKKNSVYRKQINKRKW